MDDMISHVLPGKTYSSAKAMEERPGFTVRDFTVSNYASGPKYDILGVSELGFGVWSFREITVRIY